MVLDVLFLLVGFFLLAKSADALVEGAATIATKLGMDRWVVGLTIVAWGTSMPEVVVSTLAAVDGKPGAALGNVLGSNVANAGLVLGTIGLILPRALVGRLAAREWVPVLGSLGLLWWFLADERVTRVEAAILAGLFLGYTGILIGFRNRWGDTPPAELDEEETHAQYPWLRVLIGSAGIAFGAHLVMEGAFGVAEVLGLGEGVVGLVILALGTSLPELAAGVVSARQGHAEIGLGNIVGSNVFNTFAVIGIAALAGPFGVAPDNGGWTEAVQGALQRDMPVNLAFALFLVLGPPLFRGRAARLRAGGLLAAWIAYVLVIGL